MNSVLFRQKLRKAGISKEMFALCFGFDYAYLRNQTSRWGTMNTTMRIQLEKAFEMLEKAKSNPSKKWTGQKVILERELQKMMLEGDKFSFLQYKLQYKMNKLEVKRQGKQELWSVLSQLQLGGNQEKLRLEKNVVEANLNRILPKMEAEWIKNKILLVKYAAQIQTLDQLIAQYEQELISFSV